MKWLRRMAALVALLAAICGGPVLYVEIACVSDPLPDEYSPIVADPAEQRAESRTLMTYPEWHIVYAYDDYAAVIAEGDPHEFGFLRAIWGFWSSHCTLSEQAGALGGVGSEAKGVNYVIGASFTLEMGAKGLYEETLGRLAVFVRGAERSELDDISAEQAESYADFLRQVPWYRWDFVTDAASLWDHESGGLRNWKRRLALGAEYITKAAYAKAIAAAAAAQGFDELTMRVVVADEAGLGDIAIVQRHDRGVEIETPRYREFTQMAVALAQRGIDFVEIAGNDEIMFTALSNNAVEANAVYSTPRQGRSDHRHLIMVPVASLADELRAMEGGSLTLEHIHDY